MILRGSQACVLSQFLYVLRNLFYHAVRLFIHLQYKSVLNHDSWPYTSHCTSTLCPSVLRTAAFNAETNGSWREVGCRVGATPPSSSCVTVTCMCIMTTQNLKDIY
jgi:hypothetical protein